MCGRYFLDERCEPDDAADAAFAAFLCEAAERASRQGLPMKTHGEIRPTDIVPVVATNALNRAVGAFPMRWGFSHPMRGMLVFNTRSETAEQKALFVTSVEERRCLIPASRYFEWKRDGNKKTKYRFSRADGAPLYLGGLYVRSSASPLPCFTILTRGAEGEAASVHARMPLIVPEERTEEWLSPKITYASLMNVTFPEMAICPENAGK